MPRSPPPAPQISHHMSLRGRMRGQGIRHHEMPSHGRGRPEYRSVARSSPPKRRSFSPPMKRKMSPPIRERDMSRRTKISKSSRVDDPDQMPYSSSRGVPDYVRSSGSDRYREKDFKEERDSGSLSFFRGPESSTNYDIDDLRKFTVEISRNHDGPSQSSKSLKRTITNPDDIAPVRRPDEGARPLFLNAELGSKGLTSSKAKGHEDLNEYRRVVAVDRYPVSRSQDRGRSPVRGRSPYYEEPKRPKYPERREPSPYDRHRSPPRHEFIEHREKIRERPINHKEDLRLDLDIKRREQPRFSPDRRSYERERPINHKEDLRRDLDIKRREEPRFSPDRRSYERESDLRKRIIQKRSDPFPRGDDREPPPRRFEGDWEKFPQERRSPPPHREREFGSSSFDHGFRSNREEGWKPRDEGNGWKGPPPYVREREERSRDHFEDFDRSGPPHYKNDFPPKKFFKNHEEKEFIPHSSRGRGAPSIRRGSSTFIRGRGFRGTRGLSRGSPRGFFRGSRGYPLRRPSHH